MTLEKTLNQFIGRNSLFFLYIPPLFFFFYLHLVIPFQCKIYITHYVFYNPIVWFLTLDIGRNFVYRFKHRNSLLSLSLTLFTFPLFTLFYLYVILYFIKIQIYTSIFLLVWLKKICFIFYSYFYVIVGFDRWSAEIVLSYGLTNYYYFLYLYFEKFIRICWRSSKQTRVREITRKYNPIVRFSMLDIRKKFQYRFNHRHFLFSCSLSFPFLSHSCPDFSVHSNRKYWKFSQRILIIRTDVTILQFFPFLFFFSP